MPQRIKTEPRRATSLATREERRLHLERIAEEDWITLKQALALNPRLTLGALRQRIRRGKLASRRADVRTVITYQQTQTVLLVRRDQIVDIHAPGGG